MRQSLANENVRLAPENVGVRFDFSPSTALNLPLDRGEPLGPGRVCRCPGNGDGEVPKSVVHPNDVAMSRFPVVDRGAAPYRSWA